MAHDQFFDTHACPSCATLLARAEAAETRCLEAESGREIWRMAVGEKDREAHKLSQESETWQKRAEAAERRVGAVEETLRAVRLDLWTASIHSNPQSMHDAYDAAEAKIDALLGSVSAEERLETLFPKLRHDAGQEGSAGGS